MDSNKIKALLVVVISLFGAVYLGVAAATAQLEAVAWIVGGIGLVICVALGNKIWLLLPVLSALSLRLPLPGNISTLMIAQGVIVGFAGLLFLMRKLPMKVQLTELEFWCLLFALFVLQAYARNPVGLNLFGGDMVGGRAYVEFAATLVTATLLSVLLVKPNDLRWWVRLTLIGSIGNFFIGALGILFPSLGYYLGASFSTDAADSDNQGGAVDAGRADRISFVRGISRTLAIWISSNISPLKASFHPVWAPLVLFTLGAAAFSGYRSQFAVVGLSYFVGLCYRGGFIQVLIASTIGVIGLALLAFINLVAPLPPNVQRSLSFLPGAWEQRYINDAESSTEWRTEIWIEALTSDRYIENKWLGDGLGFTAKQLQQTLALREQKGTGTTGFDYHRESILISGDYHSGPVQTIRTIGYAGLAVLILGMIRMAVRAHRQIMRSRGTEWYPTALFIGIPIIWGPFFWVFIFGSFTGGVGTLLMGTALVRMLEKNLPLPPYSKSDRTPYILKQRREQVETPV
jgi:hypothetical protein